MMAIITQHSVDNSEAPEGWKTADVTFLKKNTRAKAGNLQAGEPNSRENILLDRFYSHLKKSEPIRDSQ